jgi:hypothetical protein
VFVEWKQHTGGQGNFNTWREEEMEKIIENEKSQLE